VRAELGGLKLSGLSRKVKELNAAPGCARAFPFPDARVDAALDALDPRAATLQARCVLEFSAPRPFSKRLACAV
jgi:hypothetical protein